MRIDNEKREFQGARAADHIWLCPDGVFRWTGMIGPNHRARSRTVSCGHVPLSFSR